MGGQCSFVPEREPQVRMIMIDPNTGKVSEGEPPGPGGRRNRRKGSHNQYDNQSEIDGAGPYDSDQDRPPPPRRRSHSREDDYRDRDRDRSGRRSSRRYRSSGLGSHLSSSSSRSYHPKSPIPWNQHQKSCFLYQNPDYPPGRDLPQGIHCYCQATPSDDKKKSSIDELLEKVMVMNQKQIAAALSGTQPKSGVDPKAPEQPGTDSNDPNATANTKDQIPKTKSHILSQQSKVKFDQFMEEIEELKKQLEKKQPKSLSMLEQKVEEATGLGGKSRLKSTIPDIPDPLEEPKPKSGSGSRFKLIHTTQHGRIKKVNYIEGSRLSAIDPNMIGLGPSEGKVTWGKTNGAKPSSPKSTMEPSVLAQFEGKPTDDDQQLSAFKKLPTKLAPVFDGTGLGGADGGSTALFPGVSPGGSSHLTNLMPKRVSKAYPDELSSSLTSKAKTAANSNKNDTNSKISHMSYGYPSTATKASMASMASMASKGGNSSNSKISRMSYGYPSTATKASVALSNQTPKDSKAGDDDDLNTGIDSNVSNAFQATVSKAYPNSSTSGTSSSSSNSQRKCKVVPSKFVSKLDDSKSTRRSTATANHNKNNNNNRFDSRVFRRVTSFSTENVTFGTTPKPTKSLYSSSSSSSKSSKTKATAKNLSHKSTSTNASSFSRNFDNNSTNQKSSSTSSKKSKKPGSAPGTMKFKLSIDNKPKSSSSVTSKSSRKTGKQVNNNNNHPETASIKSRKSSKTGKLLDSSSRKSTDKPKPIANKTRTDSDEELFKTKGGDSS